MTSQPMTQAGADKLRKELNHLKFVERPDIIKLIAAARELGDLKENADYHAARERQSFIEGRIAELTAILSVAQIIEPNKVAAGGKIIFGAKVELKHEDTGQCVKYQVVGEHEVDLSSGCISVYSPVGRALIGKKLGDVVDVYTPNGSQSYEILSIMYE